MALRIRPHHAACLSLLFAGWFAAASRADEQFSLEVPGEPALTSTAVMSDSGKSLTITDSEGKRFVYSRTPQLDKGNGIGFFSDQRGRAIRWPKSGEGAMDIGDGDLRRDIAWHASRMRVHRVERDPRDPLGGPAADPRAVVRRVGPLNLAALPGARGSFTLANIGDAGFLQFYEGRDGRWEHRDSGLRAILPPGAPLVLADDRAGGLPLVYTVNGRGELVQVGQGRNLTTLSQRGDPKFIPQTHLARIGGGRGVQLAAVDDRGQLWQFDVEGRTFSEIENRPSIFEPGIPLVCVSGAEEELFLIDRRGNLLGYSPEGDHWSRPFRVASGFPSGGAVAGLFAPPGVGRPPTVLVAAVDNAGRVHVFIENGAAWTDAVVRDVSLPPGASVGLASDGGLVLSAVQADGRWRQWRHAGGAWERETIADGFPAGAPVLVLTPGPNAFAIDRTGRLIASRWLNDAWESSILSPLFTFAPRLVRREIVPNELLPPATVEFENRHSEELVVRIHNIASPERPIEVAIPPGKSVPQRIERDAGATLEEVYLVPGPGGEVVEEVHRHPLPPKRLYDVVTYANRVTSVYFDRTKKKKSEIPDEANTSLVSLGVFPLPAGEQLADGARLDVYREAQAQRNPGAAALIDGNPGGP